MTAAALEVAGLRVAVRNGSALTPTVTDFSFSVAPGESLGLVGESGSGKSLSLRAVAGVLPPGVAKTGGDVVTGGARMAMIFQEPLTALNPTRRVGDAIADVVQATRRCSRRDARAAAVALLTEVGMTDPARRARMWPHELSGGLRQRAVIAMALAHEPSILLCDEPTTALDVTVQDQVLGLLDRLRQERNVALVFVTHDLAVVATLCQRVAVMYAGQIVETGPTRDVLREPRHPYTRALLESSRTRTSPAGARPIGGQPPTPGSFPDGCRFAPRCPHANEVCRTMTYDLAGVNDQRADACVRTLELTAVNS
ncbi:ABC transporter ATP-binding protein [Microbacterium sp.]|uniref:ABC transporter ATP-binding protein n=1 Tax=Microbacterium sp. TaxID=51671 RepID=UPI002812336B|nr:ABC transporter ATP-binding protein [Microbacterium sp.]